MVDLLKNKLFTVLIIQLNWHNMYYSKKNKPKLTRTYFGVTLVYFCILASTSSSIMWRSRAVTGAMSPPLASIACTTTCFPCAPWSPVSMNYKIKHFVKHRCAMYYLKCSVHFFLPSLTTTYSAFPINFLISFPWFPSCPIWFCFWLLASSSLVANLLSAYYL